MGPLNFFVCSQLQAPPPVLPSHMRTEPPEARWPERSFVTSGSTCRCTQLPTFTEGPRRAQSHQHCRATAGSLTAGAPQSRPPHKSSLITSPRVDNDTAERQHSSALFPASGGKINNPKRELMMKRRSHFPEQPHVGGKEGGG